MSRYMKYSYITHVIALFLTILLLMSGCGSSHDENDNKYRVYYTDTDYTMLQSE